LRFGTAGGLTRPYNINPPVVPAIIAENGRIFYLRKIKDLVIVIIIALKFAYEMKTVFSHRLKNRAEGPIEARPLDRYLGPCQVVRFPVDRGTRLPLEALPDPLRAERVLFATGTFPDPNRFNDDFAALSPELIGALHDRGVRLVGIDTPSVDPFASKELPSHQACLRLDMAILEGIVLDGVPEGLYELVALPLKLAGFDASPVRAVLRWLP